MQEGNEMEVYLYGSCTLVFILLLKTNSLSGPCSKNDSGSLFLAPFIKVVIFFMDLYKGFVGKI